MKLLAKLIVVAAFCLSNLSHASLITTDLTDNDYITFNDLDWAWASPVNQENWANVNILKAPEFHLGWRFATEAELSLLVNDIGLFSFTRIDGTYIQAVAYWNTEFVHVDDQNFANGEVASAWGNGFYETFYVRDVQPVPEPSMLLMFALGILALAARQIKQRR